LIAAADGAHQGVTAIEPEIIRSASVTVDTLDIDDDDDSVAPESTDHDIQNNEQPASEVEQQPSSDVEQELSSEAERSLFVETEQSPIAEPVQQETESLAAPTPELPLIESAESFTMTEFFRFHKRIILGGVFLVSALAGVLLYLS